MFNPVEPDLRRPGAKPEHWPEGGGLYNVQQDLSELNDLSAEMPERKRELTELFESLTRELPKIKGHQ